MSNGTTTLPAVGSYVQYDVTTQSPLAPLPSAAEQTIGIIRQLFTAQGSQYAQVVWNPGSATPQTGLYTADQLCPLTQQQAADITTNMNETGQLPPLSGTPSSNYTQPQVPSQGLPPGLQSANVPVIPTLTGPLNQPLDPGTGYQ